MRIPEHKANLSISYVPTSKIDLGLSYQYNSDREDSFFNSETFETENITLDSYGLLGFNASYQVTKNIKLFMNMSNILDSAFEEVYRFQTRGRNVRAGFTLKF